MKNLNDETKLTAELMQSEISKLRAEVELLRMQLTACGAVALANTPESASKARAMNSEYISASCQDVMKAVDREMALRDQISRQAVPSLGKLRKGDQRIIDGKAWTCTDPDIDRWVCNEPEHEPSDEELISLAGEEQFLLTSWAGEERLFLFCDQDEFLDIARAILARYGSKLI